MAEPRFRKFVSVQDPREKQHLRNAQSERWATLLSRLAEVPHPEGTSNAIQAILVNFGAEIKKRDEELFHIEKDGVRGEIPILETLDKVEYTPALLRRVISILARDLPHSLSTKAAIDVTIILDILKQFTSQGPSEDLRDEYDDARASLEELASEMRAVQGNAEYALKALEEQRSALDACLKDIRDQTSKFVVLERHIQEESASEATRRNNEWQEFVQRSTEEIAAARALARESETLKGAAEIWRGKLVRHTLGFWIGLAALAGAVGGALYSIYLFWPALVAALVALKKPDGDVPYGLLVLTLVPIIAVAWILRIFSRWVTSAMTLGEDAEQRRAMLETYFRLVGDPDAKMEQSDRILILNAIFRPLPGHQSEDVAPPTLFDLIKGEVKSK